MVYQMLYLLLSVFFAGSSIAAEIQNNDRQSVIESSVSDLPILEKYQYYASKHGISVEVLYAVTLLERGVERAVGYTSPWPFVIRASDSRYYADSEDEAKEALKLYLEKYGVHLDVGLGQTNLRWNGHRVSDPSDLLNVDVALDVTGQILQEAIRSTSDRELGIGRYYTWSNNKAAKRYGRKVLSAVKKITNEQVFRSKHIEVATNKKHVLVN